MRYAEQFRGWGRAMVRAVGDWYLQKTPSEIAYQWLKYKQRDGWAHRDLLRLAHPGRVDLSRDVSPLHETLFAYICGHADIDLGELPLVAAAAKAHSTRSVREWVRLIEGNRSLTWEMLPSEALAQAEVWQALLAHNLPVGALIRNLGRMSALEVFKPFSSATKVVAERLADPGLLRKARIHPVNVLVALRTYASGHGARSDGVWTPLHPILDALNAGFYAAFGNVEPTGKRHLLATDISGSMGSAIGGMAITSREVVAALAMVRMKFEPWTHLVGFGHTLMPLSVSPSQRLDDVVRTISNLPWQSTDCALPMLWALQNRIEVDTFEIYTDNETWYGCNGHPHEALQRYRRAMGINARLAVISTTPTEFSIADPADPGSIDISGFDRNVPELLANFSRGDI